MTSIVVYSRMWRSGSGRYAQGVAEGLAGSGHHVTFIAPAGEPTDLPDSPLMRRVRPAREYAEREPASKPARALRSVRRIAGGLGSLLRARWSCPRIVVTIPEPLLFWLPVLALLRLSGARVVFICHDVEPHAWRLPTPLRWLERGAHAASYRWAWKLVVLSTAGKRAMAERFGIAPDKIAVVPHGAFDQPWVGPIPGDRRLLVFGTIRRNKQVHLAIKAATAVAGVRLTVAGGGDANDPGYLDECRAAARGREDAVVFETGYIADDRVSALLAESDGLLLPYADFESQSGVAVLAGMAGRPIIAAAAGGIPDLIAMGLAAEPVAPPVGVDEIAAAVRAFVAIPAAEWSRRAEAGRDSLARALAWPHVGALIAGLFDAHDAP